VAAEIGFFFLTVAIAAGVLIIIWTLRNGISPSPTSPKVKRKLLEALPEEVKGKIFELGAGWGTLAFPLSNRYPDNAIEAYENSPIPFGYCCFIQRLKKHNKLHFHCQDFFTVDLSEAGLVLCYLFPGAMEKLRDKFVKELPIHSIIMTHTFRIPGWKPSQIIICDDLYRTTIYIYSMADRHG
jgi:hypothetical protein